MSLKLIVLFTLLIFIDHSVATRNESDGSLSVSKQHPVNKGQAVLNKFENAQPIGNAERDIEIHENPQESGRNKSKNRRKSEKEKKDVSRPKKYPQNNNSVRNNYYIHLREKSVYTPEEQDLINRLEARMLASTLDPRKNYTLDEIDPFKYPTQGSFRPHSQYLFNEMSHSGIMKNKFLQLNSQFAHNDSISNLRISTRVPSTDNGNERISVLREAQTARLRRPWDNEDRDNFFYKSDLADLVRSGTSGPPKKKIII